MTVLPRLLLVAALCASAPAFAAPVDAAPSRVVRTGDLDLASAAGAATLHARVARAARAVSGIGSVDPRDLSQLAAARASEKVALASAAPQVEVALAAARSGHAYAANVVHVAPGS